EFHLGLAETMTRRTQRDHATAREHLLRALALRPGWFPALVRLGEAALEVSRVDEMVAAFEQAVAQRPDHAVLHYRLSEALAQARRLPEAERHLARALELDPTVSPSGAKDLDDLRRLPRTRGQGPKKGRYPDTEQINSELHGTIIGSVTKDLRHVRPF